jgi:hypothetical protein
MVRLQRRPGSQAKLTVNIYDEAKECLRCRATGTSWRITLIKLAMKVALSYPLWRNIMLLRPNDFFQLRLHAHPIPQSVRDILSPFHLQYEKVLDWIRFLKSQPWSKAHVAFLDLLVDGFKEIPGATPNRRGTIRPVTNHESS